MKLRQPVAKLPEYISCNFHGCVRVWHQWIIGKRANGEFTVSRQTCLRNHLLVWDMTPEVLDNGIRQITDGKWPYSVSVKVRQGFQNSIPGQIINLAEIGTV